VAFGVMSPRYSSNDGGPIRPTGDGEMSGWAVSRRGSNEEAFEGFSGGEESEGCAGSFVEFFGDGGQVGLVVGDRGALGEVLAQESVGRSYVCQAAAGAVFARAADSMTR